MSPLKVTKEWTSSNSAFLKGQSSPTESMSSAEGGETSIVATVMIGGMILNINRFLCCLSLVFTFEDLHTAAVREPWAVQLIHLIVIFACATAR